MDSLFPLAVAADDIPAIPGLRYLPDYIDARQERELAAAIDRMPWNTDWQRRRQPYGGAYGNSGEGLPIPDWGREPADRLDEMLVEARFLRLAAIFLAAVAAHRRDEALPHLGNLPQPAARFVAVHAGHADVADDHVWPPHRRHLDRGGSRVHHLDLP